MLDLKRFHGPNVAYVYDLYERYLLDPDSVDESTRALFRGWVPPAEPSIQPPARGLAAEGGALDPISVARAADLAEAIRERGHLAAKLDPLGRPRPHEPALDISSNDLTEADLETLPASIVGGPVAAGAPSALEAIRRLRDLYQSTAGYEFGHVMDPDARLWLRDAVETRRFVPALEPSWARALLARLTEVEAFERFLHRTFPGQTRFSIEGNDALIPMLDEVVAGAAGAEICQLVVGMAHRGRLNVLAHVLGKSYASIVGAFQGAIAGSQEVPSSPDMMECPGWTGDVKYHLGGRRAYAEDRVVRVVMKLAPNPSHLEFVDPVVEGMVRAAEEARDEPGGPRFFADAALAVLIHGDAAFPGQGIVAETLNLSRLRGYQTGGTLHVVVNNQLGFTAGPAETRSTRYASDLAKGFEIPIVHVNADDPRACMAAVRLAFAYRQRFRGDFLIDLIGYRRWGHNEGDEPAYTQPVEYALIADHPTVRELWADELGRRGLVPPDEAERLLEASYERLRAARAELARHPTEVGLEESPCGPSEEAEGCAEVEDLDTGVPIERLARLGSRLAALPPGFEPDPKLARVLQRRAAVSGSTGAVDWAHAESLAFAAILADGTPIRLTGQDTARGTFSQRHALVKDRRTGATHVPLQKLPESRASFDVVDSPLSEAAAVGFEYGYSVEAPTALVLWEAQYGDFVNVAQAVIDQFVVSGRAKWGQTPSLVLLLPHGHEGQGPEHSSARLERFLQLAVDGEVRVVVPTTAAQYFHLLRQHAASLACSPRPLVVMTPKSLLRNPAASSSLAELAGGRFRPVLDDELARSRPDAVSRLVLCSGKVYFDLVSARPTVSTRGDKVEAATVASTAPERGLPDFAPAAGPADGVGAVRLEQLYPFPVSDLTRVVASYPALREVVWLQEEPENQGAWRFVEPRLRALVPGGVAIRYVGRRAMASSSEGYPAWHSREQERIVREALTGTTLGAARGFRRVS